MDAVPIRLGQEFSGYAQILTNTVRRVRAVLPSVSELALGGTAVGTGLNSAPDFAPKIIRIISEEIGIPLCQAPNLFEALSTRDGLVEASGALRSAAASLTKVANDIRWLGSGPRCGIGEILLPDLQPGSSIMPGKVNPVMSEMLLMICAQVVGNDAAIGWGGAAGNFELNVMIPMMAYNLLHSVGILASGCRLFASRCVEGIEPNVERSAALIEQSLAMVTALNEAIGYDAAAAIAKESRQDRQDRPPALHREECATERGARSTTRRAPHDRAIIGPPRRHPHHRRKGAHVARPPLPRRLAHSHLRPLAFSVCPASASPAVPVDLDPRLLARNGGPAPPCDAPAMVFDSASESRPVRTPGCHDATAPQAGLNLTKTRAGRPPAGHDALGHERAPSAPATTTPYLVSGVAARDRVLLDKMSSRPVRDRLPQLPAPLNATEMPSLQAWSTAVTTGLHQYQSGRTTSPSAERARTPARAPARAASAASEKSVTPRASQSASQRRMAAASTGVRAGGGEQQHVAVDGRLPAVERRQRGGEGAHDRPPFRPHLRHVDGDDAARAPAAARPRRKNACVASASGIPSPA